MSAITLVNLFVADLCATNIINANHTVMPESITYYDRKKKCVNTIVQPTASETHQALRQIIAKYSDNHIAAESEEESKQAVENYVHEIDQWVGANFIPR